MIYDVGETAELFSGQLLDTDGEPVTGATGTVTVKTPAGAVLTPSVTELAGGRYTASVLLTEAGLWPGRWAFTAPVQVVEEFTLEVRPSRLDVPLPAWTPTVDDVAALVPRRTGTVAPESGSLSAGAPSGTFSVATIPTADQVRGLIDGVVTEVRGKAGEPPAEIHGTARHVAALGTAALIESSYGDDDDHAKVLAARYLEGLGRLAETTGGATSAATRIAPVYTFPTLVPLPEAW